jgi:hypothetical protein
LLANSPGLRDRLTDCFEEQEAARANNPLARTTLNQPLQTSGAIPHFRAPGHFHVRGGNSNVR